jgi:hypothetical protein
VLRQILGPGLYGPDVVVSVTQEHGGTPVVQMIPSTREVSSDSGWAAFELTNSECGIMRWQASTVTPWITDIAPRNGELIPGQSVTVSAFYEPNASTSVRNGAVTIFAEDSGNSPQDFIIRQRVDFFPVLAVSSGSFSTDGNPGSTSFAVENTGTGSLDWSVSGACGWVTGVSPASGALTAGQRTNVTVNFNRNTTGEPRTCTLTINGSNAEGSPQTFVVTQTSIDQPRVDVSPVSRTVTETSGEVIYTVRNIGTGTLRFESDFAADWIQRITPAAGNLEAGASAAVTVAYAANESAASRIGSITFRGDQLSDGSVTVTLSQAADDTPRLEVDSAELPAGPGAGSQTLVIRNSGGSAFDWSVATTCDWVTQLTPSAGTLGTGQTASVTVAYAANGGNARACTLTVTASGVEGSPKTVSLTQAGTSQAILTLTPTTQTLGKEAGVANITLENTGGGVANWVAAASCPWISNLTPPSGTLAGGASITLTAEYTANGGLLPRSCAVTVTAPEAQGGPVTATLGQAGGSVFPCGCLDFSIGAGKSSARDRLGDILFIGAGILVMLAATRMRRS